MQALSTEWLPVSIAPTNEDLEVCVLDYDGIVRALVFPCHTDGAEWVDASGNRHAHIQPTHWRKWTERQYVEGESSPHHYPQEVATAFSTHEQTMLDLAAPPGLAPPRASVIFLT